MENKECEATMHTVKAKVGNNHRQLHSLKHTLEQKQYAEWKPLLGHWEEPGSLTMSMMLFNKVFGRGEGKAEERRREEGGEEEGGRKFGTVTTET